MPDPLHQLHTDAEAEFQPYADLQIVSTFGQPQAEYAAIRKAAALMDLNHRGLLRVTGKDRLPFLNNLLTNQTFDKNTKTGMPPGTGVYAFLLNAKTGRIISDMNVLERGDQTLLEMDRRLLATVQQSLDKYRFAEQVQFAIAGDFCELALHGPKAEEIIGQSLQPLASTTITLQGAPITIWRDDAAGSPGYHLLVPTDSVIAIWNDLSPRARPTGWAAFNTARIEAGRPLFGIDFDDTMLPAETAQMNRAVSFTKGCYPGQEVVARMHARQQVAKQIAGLKFSDDNLPIAGAPVTDDQSNTIGGITSSSISPMLSNTAVAIALLKRPHFAPGTVVNVPAEGELRRAVVVELPFLKNKDSE